MNKIKSIVTILITVMLMSMTASAYVPPELRTGTYMSEVEIVKVALAEHDVGHDSRWVMDTLEDACIHHTNSGRPRNNYAQLREWIAKIDAQSSPDKAEWNWIEPVDDAGWQGPGSN